MFRNGSINLHLVVLEDGQLDLPVLVLDLLGGGVVLLLPLLGATPEPEHKVKGALFLNVIITKRSAIFKLFASKDKSLLVWWNTFLVMYLGFDIFNSI